MGYVILACFILILQLHLIYKTLGKINSNMMSGNDMTLSNMRVVIEEIQQHNELVNMVKPMVADQIKEKEKSKDKPDDGLRPLLVEDDDAPDAREYFDKDLIAMTGFSINDFREKGERLNNGDMMIGWVLDQYRLESYADAPYYHLFKNQT